MKKAYVYQMPLGALAIAEENGAISDLFFAEQPLLRTFEICETDLICETKRQLMQYFSGNRQSFDLPLAPAGTDFQHCVWRALCEIPYGATASYGQIALRVGNAKASRAIGMANHRNPIAIVIPCHRVIGANGQLVGYAGGLDTKQFLLDLEQTYKRKEGHTKGDGAMCMMPVMI